MGVYIPALDGIFWGLALKKEAWKRRSSWFFSHCQESRNCVTDRKLYHRRYEHFHYPTLKWKHIGIQTTHKVLRFYSSNYYIPNHFFLLESSPENANSEKTTKEESLSGSFCHVFFSQKKTFVATPVANVKSLIPRLNCLRVENCLGEIMNLLFIGSSLTSQQNVLVSFFKTYLFQWKFFERVCLSQIY